ncbi:hypothetical protein ASF53_08285 [Methylobacterium sp. Leaf123]|uniref:hypothetical protein n=1 Tax=Methylobacterium sp. Leaf123 TaxID=1736264 RepID=UPI0006F6190C|nr:hypothetical protein [Methylobacterium sp. Leaf123]KQQ14621.1 hypothetical protein ASF53_08285 [Methylobacterium sp. Leaf123]
MLQFGTKVLLAACVAGFIPSTAFAQRVISLDGSGPQVTASDVGGAPSDVTAGNVIAPDGIAYRAETFGPTPASRVGVAQNLVTPNGAAPVPNVNDCTFIRDPIALRDCINLYEGQRLGPGPRTDALRPGPITNEALIDAAGPIPGSGKGRSGNRERVNPTDLRGPSATYIDQVTPSR